MIADFVEGCEFEPPFHLVCIDARGTVSVTRYGHHGIDAGFIATRLPFALLPSSSFPPGLKASYGAAPTANRHLTSIALAPLFISLKSSGA